MSLPKILTKCPPNLEKRGSVMAKSVARVALCVASLYQASALPHQSCGDMTLGSQCHGAWRSLGCEETSSRRERVALRLRGGAPTGSVAPARVATNADAVLSEAERVMQTAKARVGLAEQRRANVCALPV